MRYGKTYLRKKFILIRKKNYLKKKKFKFNLIFKLIRKHFLKKKVIIAGYYPSNYEVNILKFIENLTKVAVIYKASLVTMTVETISEQTLKSFTIKCTLAPQQTIDNREKD